MGEIESPASSLPPARRGNDGLAGTGGPDGLGGFGRSFLSDGVGRGQANRPDDVFNASSFLHANGLLPAPTREVTEEFHRGIEAAQSKLNDLSRGGLHIDGFARPWGPTELLSQRAVTSGQMKAPPPNSTGTRATDQNSTGRPDDRDKDRKPVPNPSEDRNQSEDTSSAEHLQALLDSASRNRRAAVERASRKEKEFTSARDGANQAWEKVQAEGSKLGIQIGIGLLTKRGRPASAGLAAAIDAYNAAMARAEHLESELKGLQNDVDDWDAEIRDILSRMGRAGPTS